LEEIGASGLYVKWIGFAGAGNKANMLSIRGASFGGVRIGGG
jgi:hypothetical protein